MYPDNLSMKAIEIDPKRKKIFIDLLERIGMMKLFENKMQNWKQINDSRLREGRLGLRIIGFRM